MKAQLDWVEEDRRECENAKRALQDDFNSCVEEVDMMRSRMTETNVNDEQLKQSVDRLQNEKDRLAKEIEASREELSEDIQERMRNNARLAADNEELRKRLEQDGEKSNEETAELRSKMKDMIEERDRLQGLVDKQQERTQLLSSGSEESKKQKYEKELLVSQLEAVARERRQLDKQLSEKEGAKAKLQADNEVLKNELENIQASTRQASSNLHDEKAALKNELSDVYMKHQRDLEKIERFKIENHRLSRDIEQLKRELNDKNKELENLRALNKQRRVQQEKAPVKREVSSIFFKPEMEPVSVILKPTEVRFSEPASEPKETEFSIGRISNNPFLSLDKARSKSMDDIVDDKHKNNPFAPVKVSTTTTAKETPRAAFAKEMPRATSAKKIPRAADTSSLPTSKPEAAGFSLLSDDLRASVESLDSIGYTSDEEEAKPKGRKPTKEYVNRLVATFEEGQANEEEASKVKPKFDIYT